MYQRIDAERCFVRGIRKYIEIRSSVNREVYMLLERYIKEVLKEGGEGRKVIAFDFHGTLVSRLDDGGVEPRYEMIEKLKSYYKNYDFVVVYTASPESERREVEGQLASLGIPYDVLMMEKPRFDKMYDDRYVGPDADWV